MRGRAGEVGESVKSSSGYQKIWFSNYLLLGRVKLNRQGKATRGYLRVPKYVKWQSGGGSGSSRAVVIAGKQVTLGRHSRCARSA